MYHPFVILKCYKTFRELLNSMRVLKWWKIWRWILPIWILQIILMLQLSKLQMVCVIISVAFFFLWSSFLLMQIDIKHTFSSWQHRLPNTWDDIYFWNELLIWRQRVFGFIADSMHDTKNPMMDKSAMMDKALPLDKLGNYEMAWSINKFAHIARIQGLPELCLGMNQI